MHRCAFDDLHELPEALHAWLDALIAACEADPAEDPMPLYGLRMAAHEWVANLVQHAIWNGAPPVVTVTVAPGGMGVYACMIEDTSAGFDLAASLAARRAAHHALPERGMGLMMLASSTQHLEYRTLAPHRHRLSFLVTPLQPDDGLDLTAESNHG